MLDSTRGRIGAATGVAYGACLLVGNALATAGQSSSAHPSGQQVLLDVDRAASSTSATAGFMLELLGFALFLPFLGTPVLPVMRTQATRQGAPLRPIADRRRAEQD
jgi:hypothetical protein